MDEGFEYTRELAKQYSEYIKPLLSYVPWLETKVGNEVSRMYDTADTGVETFAFPVFDGTLMSFVKVAAKTPLMDKNYAYVYSRNGIRNHSDEKRHIEAATIREWNVLSGILSKYVLGGQVKPKLWSEAVENGIFVAVIKKMQSIVEYWS